MDVGFIGLGQMGSGMANNLLAAGSLTIRCSTRPQEFVLSLEITSCSPEVLLRSC